MTLLTRFTVMRKRMLIAILAAFVVGGCCGWLLNQAFADDPRAQSNRVIQPPTIEEPRAYERREQAEPTAVAPGVVQKPQDAAQVDLKALLDRLRTEERVDAPPGAGEVTGRVIDEDGNPVRGVELKLNAWGTSYERMPWHFPVEDKDDFIESIVRYWVRKEKHAANAVRTTQSNADGRFVFSEVPAGRANLGGTHHDGAVLATDGNPWAYAEPGQFVELRLVRLISLEVNIVCDEAPADFKTFLDAYKNSTHAGRVEAEPGKPALLRLPPGTYNLTCSVDDARFERPNMVVTIERGKPHAPLTVHINAKPRLYGKANFTVARPASWAVFAVRVRGGLSDQELLESMPRDRREAAVAADGTFSFNGIDRGEYLVVIQSYGRTLACTRASASPSAGASVFSVEAPGASQCLLVTLFYPPGEARSEPEFAVHAGNEKVGRRYEVWCESTTRYRLVTAGVSKRADKESEGGLAVTVHGLGVATARLQSLQGEAFVSFHKPASLHISVRGVPEECWRAAAIDVACEDGKQTGSYVENERRDDDAVQAVLRGIQPGRYVVTVILNEAFMAPMTQTIELSGESASVELQMPALFEVRLDGKAHNLAGAFSIRGADKMHAPSVVFTNNSIAIIPYMAAGTYSLSFQKDNEYKEFKFTVNSSATVKIP